MSYHVESYVRLGDVMKFIAAECQTIPIAVQSFIVQAAQGLTSQGRPSSTIVHIKAVGHLCDGRGSYAVSSDETLVEEIEVREFP